MIPASIRQQLSLEFEQGGNPRTVTDHQVDTVTSRKDSQTPVTLKANNMKFTSALNETMMLPPKSQLMQRASDATGLNKDLASERQMSSISKPATQGPILLEIGDEQPSSYKRVNSQPLHSQE